MKLTNIRRCGRYLRPDGNPVNVHKGCEKGVSWEVRFYIYRGKRMLITEAEFWKDWKKIGD